MIANEAFHLVTIRFQAQDVVYDALCIVAAVYVVSYENQPIR